MKNKNVKTEKTANLETSKAVKTETKAEPQNAISEKEALKIRLAEIDAAEKEQRQKRIADAKQAREEKAALKELQKKFDAEEKAEKEEANQLLFVDSQKMLIGELKILLENVHKMELTKADFSKHFGTLRNIATEVNKTLPAKIGMGETLTERYERVYKEYCNNNFDSSEMSGTSNEILNNISKRNEDFLTVLEPNKAQIEANRLVKLYV